jgi:hypothetical protein
VHILQQHPMTGLKATAVWRYYKSTYNSMPMASTYGVEKLSTFLPEIAEVEQIPGKHKKKIMFRLKPVQDAPLPDLPPDTCGDKRKKGKNKIDKRKQRSRLSSATAPSEVSFSDGDESYERKSRKAAKVARHLARRQLEKLQPQVDTEKLQTQVDPEPILGNLVEGDDTSGDVSTDIGGGDVDHLTVSGDIGHDSTSATSAVGRTVRADIKSRFSTGRPMTLWNPKPPKKKSKLKDQQVIPPFVANLRGQTPKSRPFSGKRFKDQKVSVIPVLSYSGPYPAHKRIDNIATNCIQSLAQANQHVSLQRIEALLLQRLGVESLHELGLEHIEDLTAVHEHGQRMREINTSIQAFVNVRYDYCGKL